MFWSAQALLFLWPLLVMVLFNALPPRKAVANLFVTAWLFLPNGGFASPACPTTPR